MSSDFAIPGLMPLSSLIQEDTDLVHFLQPHSRKHTNWQGIESIGPFTINGEAPYYPAEKIRMELTIVSRHCFRYTLSSEPDFDGVIEITDPATWWFAVPEQPLPLLCGLWNGVIIVTDSRGIDQVIYRVVLPIVP